MPIRATAGHLAELALIAKDLRKMQQALKDNGLYGLADQVKSLGERLKKMSEGQIFPREPRDRQWGWTIDCDFLDKAEKKTVDEDMDDPNQPPSREMIQAILLGAEEALQYWDGAPLRKK